MYPQNLSDTTPSHARSASNWSELLMHHDLDFVVCAYRTVLHREPDPEGRATWLALLRGGNGKVELLRRLRRSDEAQRIGEPFDGFDRLLRWQKYARIPLLGRIIAGLQPVDGPSLRAKNERRLEALLGQVLVEKAGGATFDRPWRPDPVAIHAHRRPMLDAYASQICNDLAR
jgi:hypothetical protein